MLELFFIIFNKTTLIKGELVHVTYDEYNPLFVEVENVYFTGILEKTYLEDKYHSKGQD